MPNPQIPYSGCLDQSAITAILGVSPFSGSPNMQLLTGSADAINPHFPGNYVIKTAGVDAITLTAPTAGSQLSGGDDGCIIMIVSDTTAAHTVTATSLLANGTALKSVATFAAFRGAMLVLRAFNGVWQVIVPTISATAAVILT